MSNTKSRSEKTQKVKKPRGSTKPDKDAKKRRSFGAALNDFIVNTSSLKESYPITVNAVHDASTASTHKFSEYIKRNNQLIAKHNNENYEMSTEERREYDEMIDEIVRSSKKIRVTIQSPIIISRSFIVSLISQFDSLIGSLVQLLHEKNPDLMNSSNKQITFSELLTYNSVEEARKDILDTEIEKVLYRSRKEQVDYLAEKSAIKLFDYLPNWKEFLEVTERRNLFVHANGIVSQKYIDQCKSAGSSQAKGLKVGQELEVSAEYYSEAYRSVVEVGFIILILIWRKTEEKSQHDIDNTINDTCYEMIDNEEYGTAVKLLEFAHLPTLQKGRNEHAEIVMLVNLAQAYKWMGNKKKMDEILKRKAWSTLREDYRIAEKVLTDDFNSAATLLKHLAETETVKRKDIRSWPLFKEFRRANEFRDVYKEVYGKAFVDEQTAQIEEIERISQAKADLN